MKKFFLVILLLMSVNFVFSQDFTKDNATACISESQEGLQELIDANFSVARQNDTLQKAIDIYESQSYYDKTGRKGNFNSIEEYCNNFFTVYDAAFYSRDSFNVLLTFYNMSFTDGMNNTQIENTIREIKNEIQSERYEKVPALIDRGYDEISQMQRDYSVMNRFYYSTVQGIKNFLYANWRILGVVFFLLLIFILFLRISMKRYFLKRRIMYLQARKIALKEYLKLTQLEYFQKGKISEADYQLRSKKFAEMIRDIDRDLPLLQEKLIKAGEEEDVAVYGKRNVTDGKKNVSRR